MTTLVDNEAIDLGSSDVAPVRDVLVELDDATFRMVLTWRERQALWYLDLYTNDGTELCSGVAMQPASPVLLRRQGGAWPGGVLMLVAIDGSTTAATLAGLGVTHELVYIPAANVAAWRDEQSPTSDLTIT